MPTSVASRTGGAKPIWIRRPTTSSASNEPSTNVKRV
jgi:hypothetical protein